jgi:hypothetical protein
MVKIKSLVHAGMADEGKLSPVKLGIFLQAKINEPAIQHIYPKTVQILSRALDTKNSRK